jgi:glycosyltransferase involved in cell wall biosynthesis
MTTPTVAPLNLAIISDQLAGGIGGAESILFAAMDLYPQAPVYTTVLNKAIVPYPYNQHPITPTFIQQLPNAIKWYKGYLPLMPLGLELLNLQAFDVIFSSHHSMAKGIIPRPDAAHLCYCHSPARYLWDMFWTYSDLNGFGPAKQFMVAALSQYLRIWDVAAVNRVDYFLANSTFTAKRINSYYRRPAEVLFPPVNTHKFSNQGTDDFYLMVGRLVAYKGFELAVDVFNQLKKRLIIVGSGPEFEALKAKAGPTVTLTGRIELAELTKLMGTCKGFIFPGKEDFGIVMAEAQAAGKPVIALNAGGAVDIVKPNETGILADDYTVEAFTQAIVQAEQTHWNAAAISQHAQQFDVSQFKARLQTLLNDAPNLVKGKG